MWDLILYEKSMVWDNEKFNLIEPYVHFKVTSLLLGPLILKQSAMLLYASVYWSHRPLCKECSSTLYLSAKLLLRTESIFFKKSSTQGWIYVMYQRWLTS